MLGTFVKRLGLRSIQGARTFSSYTLDFPSDDEGKSGGALVKIIKNNDWELTNIDFVYDYQDTHIYTYSKSDKEMRMFFDMEGALYLGMDGNNAKETLSKIKEEYEKELPSEKGRGR
jgi:hypothetical protein